MALGDLPLDLTEQREGEQAFPMGNIASGRSADVGVMATSVAGMSNTQPGSPSTNPYSVSVYDSRPPNAVDFNYGFWVEVSEPPP